MTIDKDTGEITVTIPGDAKPGDKITVPVVVTYPDGSKDNVDVTVTVEKPEAPAPKQNEEFEPGYEDGSGKPGEDVKVPAPGFKDKDGKDTKAPEGTKFTPGENAPGGVTIDKDTGEITVTIPGDAKPGDKITVPVEVTYPDGSKDNVDVTVTVEKDATPVTQRVTFGVKVDGSIVESDGDNTTAEELPESVRDVVVTLTAEDGTEFKSNDNGETWRGAKGSPVVQNFGLADIPAGTYKVSVSGLDDVNKDNLKLKEDSQLRDGATVEITGNTGNLFVELEAVDSKKYEPAYEDKLVVPGKETKSSPSFTGKDGSSAKAPEGSEFKITDGFTAPEGYEVKIDENTGEITVTFPDGSKLNKDTVEEFDVPVTVTYPDGSTDKTDAKFKLDTDNDGKPDTEDGDDDNDGIPDEDDSNPKVPNANDHFEPGYEDGSGKPGSDVKIDAPKFTDKDGKDTKAPEGTKFTPGENVPDGVKIDENTGEITVTIPGDAKPGDKITVPVEVTYPDGTKDNVDVTVTVEQPDAPAPKQNEEFEPGYEDGSGKPGDDVKVPAPEFKDKDGKDTKAPEGTKFTPGDNAPDGVTIDENTGEITVKVPEDAKPGDKITVPVVVTYPDGSKDTVDVTVTVEEPEAPAEKPDWNDDKGQPGDKVEIPNTGGPVEDGTTVETEGPGKAEIDEDGKITVDIDKDAKPGDKVVVIVKDKDGNEIDRVVVEVEKPADKPAEKPDWKDNSGKPGENVVIPNEGGKVPEGSTVETEGPGKAEIDEDGNLVVDINDDAKPGDKVTVVVKDKDGKVIDTVTVTVEKPEAPAEQPAPGGNDNGTAQPKPGTSNGNGPVKRVPLPRTGAEVAGVAGAAAALIAAGLGLVFSRRRREGEEN